MLVFRGLYGHKRVTFELCHSALEQSMELALYKSHYYYYVPTKYQLPTPYHFIKETARTNFFPPPAHLDTIVENNTLKTIHPLRAVG